jgi:RHH-type proline utilization regulon transcriptional repressor/proline dehydrogenase/delta 1-pyrroline-5-carboxylate dehydrogenase
MRTEAPLSAIMALRSSLREAALADEASVVVPLLRAATLSEDSRRAIATRATLLVEGVRTQRSRLGDLDTFLAEYSLSSQEGVVLMCLAEALLRIPDSATADRLIRDKLGAAHWESHLGHSDSAFVNASTWALMLTGRLMQPSAGLGTEGIGATLRRLAARIGEPLLREALMKALSIMSRQFVMGRTIDEALSRAADWERKGFRHSYDMLGEAARTAQDARRYMEAYSTAIAAIAATSAGRSPAEGPGLSVKLSALHPRFEATQRARVMAELVPRVVTLCRLAAHANIGLTIDAEEADRLDLSLDVIGAVLADPGLDGWDGFGLAVQAYQKRALPLLDWLAEMARGYGRQLLVRLVKGAYWDSEIKRAQERALSGYPVFTRKEATDVSYLACAARLLADPAAFFPQFATHNAHSVAAVMEMAKGRSDFEFQRLHGMGEALYEQIVPAIPCRTYAPVGSHEDLLPYLVRRLLENGANTSFINRIADDALPVAQVIADPVATLAAAEPIANPRIPLPADLFAPQRRNSAGFDLSDPDTQETLLDAVHSVAGRSWLATPVVAGNEIMAGMAEPVLNPADRHRAVGSVIAATDADVASAVAHAHEAAADWDDLGGDERACRLERAADLFEASRPDLLGLIVTEAGRTIPDALSEIREAVDFLRYYATEARRHFAAPLRLPGVTGESNALSLHGRGVFACISPWNFPLAIFTGQIAAALAAGNAVAAKPAEQTPLVAAHAVRLLHQAGIPLGVLHLLPGDGSVGHALVSHPGIDGVAFTGSTVTARTINRVLAAREGAIVPLIAETGGLNAMIVDSSALPEQVVADVIDSAFRSAGQRCSALRLLFIQRECHDRIVAMLKGAAEELAVGDPALLSTDVGPVIDADALATLQAHAGRLRSLGPPLLEIPLGADCAHGTFFAPIAFGLDDLAPVQSEVFGPILHIIPFSSGRLTEVADAIAATGSGLTLGIHSRIGTTVETVRRRLKVGNTYVNRAMVGAVVGAQPFGGEGLSGTGPKAGGPHTLFRFAVERCLTINLAAAGGNASLLTLEEDG